MDSGQSRLGGQAAMSVMGVREPSGYVFRVERKRGQQWYAKYRLPDGRQVKKHLGPAWTERGRPPAGYLTKRTAEAALREIFEQARQGTLPGMTRTGISVDQACDEYLRWVREDRGRKPSTVDDYRRTLAVHVRPTFGEHPIESLTVQAIEAWLAERRATEKYSERTLQKAVVVFNGVMVRACKRHGLKVNPLSGVERPRPKKRLDIDVLSPAEVLQLVGAATRDGDAALYATAAFTGLRQGELLALRWQDVDFPAATVRVVRAFTHGDLTTPKNGRSRAVPLAPDAASRLRQLFELQGEPPETALVFPGPDGEFQVARLVRRRYVAALDRAGLRRLRFHDLRHTFGTRMVGHVDLLELREMMGHASITTTERYLHYRPRNDLADKVAAAFAV